MVSYVLKGEALAGAAYFVSEALTPLPWPKKWGANNLVVIAQYGLIAGTLEGVISSIFTRTMGDMNSFILSVSLSIASLCGAFAFKQYYSYKSLEEYTGELGKEADDYKESVEKASKMVTTLQMQIKKLNQTIQEKEQHEVERQKEIIQLNEQLKQSKFQIEKMQKSVEDLKIIPAAIGNSIDQLAKKISDFASVRKDLNGDLTKKIGEQQGQIKEANVKLSEVLSNLDSENKETEGHLSLLTTLIKNLEGVVQSVLSLYEEVEKSMAKMKEELKTWQVDELIEALRKEGNAIGASSENIKKVTDDAKAEMEKSNKNQAELNEILNKHTQILRGLK